MKSKKSINNNNYTKKADKEIEQTKKAVDKIEREILIIQNRMRFLL